LRSGKLVAMGDMNRFCCHFGTTILFIITHPADTIGLFMALLCFSLAATQLSFFGMKYFLDGLWPRFRKFRFVVYFCLVWLFITMFVYRDGFLPSLRENVYFRLIRVFFSTNCDPNLQLDMQLNLYKQIRTN